MSSKTKAAKLRPIEPPDPGVLLPGVIGDVALGRIRRQIEVPRQGLVAPTSALSGTAGIVHAAGQLARAERVMAVVRRLGEAEAAIAGALAALDELERNER